MSIKAAIFDFGGVLVRTHNQEGRLKWDRRLGLAEGELYRLVFDSEPAQKATLGEISEEDMWEKLAVRLQLSSAEMAGLREDFWRGDHLDEDLVGFIQTLRPALRTAILSNAWSGARQLFTDTYHLQTAFDYIFISAEENLRKPDPKIFDLALRRMGVLPQETIFVDDFEINVIAASRLGLQGILFETTDQVRREIQSLLK